jgi:hypothetical protein
MTMKNSDTWVEPDFDDWKADWDAAAPDAVALLDREAVSDTASTLSCNGDFREVVESNDDLGFVSEVRAGQPSSDEEISDDDQPISSSVTLEPQLQAPLFVAQSLLRAKAKPEPKPKAKAKDAKAKAKGKAKGKDANQRALPWCPILSATDDASSSDPVPRANDASSSELSTDDASEAATEAANKTATELASASEAATETAPRGRKRLLGATAIAVEPPQGRKRQPKKKPAAAPAAVVVAPPAAVIVAPPAAVAVPPEETTVPMGVELDARPRCSRCGDLLDPLKCRFRARVQEVGGVANATHEGCR